MLFSKFHLIHNFPPNYHPIKKVIANVIYFLGGIVIHDRKNLLTHKDLIIARHKIRKGDVILAANKKELSALAIDGLFTHAILAADKKHFISATGDGVGFESWHKIATHNDSLAVIRIPQKVKNRREIASKAVDFARAQLGKPYDFFFEEDETKFFCTELVNSAFHHAGYDTGLENIKPTEDLLDRIEEKLIKNSENILHPDEFLQSNFEIIFLSHNLHITGPRIEMKENKKRNKKQTFFAHPNN